MISKIVIFHEMIDKSAESGFFVCFFYFIFFIFLNIHLFYLT